MASAEWYRSKTWNEEIEEAFNEKLRRSRSQMAQYLRIQGSMLEDEHPEAAIRLLKRCIDEGDEFHIPHALIGAAHAQLIQGDVDAALDTLEALIRREEQQPRIRTTASIDYPFLVALYGRTERYQTAIEQLERHGQNFFESMIFEAEAARAMIFEDRGEHAIARAAARRALKAASVEVGWVPDNPEVGLVPSVPSPIHDRLKRIAGLT